MYKNELEIDVFRCVNALVKKKGFIALISVLFFLIGLGLTLDVGMDQYTAVATVYAAADTTFSESASAVTAMNAYLDVATSYKVSQRAALILGRSDIDASDVKKALSVGSSAKSSGSTTVSNYMSSSATIISFSATTNDPELSRQIADAAAESYVIEMANILKSDAVKKLDDAPIGSLSRNASVHAWRRRIFAMAIGVLFACMIVIWGEIFNRKVRTIREATIRGQLPIIGIIPDYKE